MFMCERCGSRYSAMHAAAMENCPRCMIRDRTSAPLTFKAFESPDRGEVEMEMTAACAESRGRTQEVSA
jgi:DNA-directed RNA polymerase subunit RPC12/RpoP